MNARTALALILAKCYTCTMVTAVSIERVQTGLRMERRLLKVLKGLAEHLDIALGELVEGIALHALEGKQPFSAETQEKINALKGVYDLTLTAADSHALTERRDGAGDD